MTRNALRILLPLALTAASPALAQEVAPRPTPLADALANQVRTLAANPRDLSALISAGTLSVKLADPAAALAFFARAQAISPSDPRITAGRAGALVLLERPGEALQLYQTAERAGLSMRPYLAERGLAYDLTGQPGYAQRDYRSALIDSRDDETIRRLALSLGVSGKRDEAMTLLDPLLRKSDRAAWRARACILAMGGDPDGAERIATNMMPGGSALGPFLRRLQWLSLADRAFAVHFGSLNASLARQNDARLAPAVALLPPEPAPLPAATQVAVRGVPPPAAGRRDRTDRRDRRSRRGEGAQVASRTPLPTPAADVPSPPAPASARTYVPSAPVQVEALTPSPTSTLPPAASTASRVETFTPPSRSTSPTARFVSSTATPTPTVRPTYGPARDAVPPVAGASQDVRSQPGSSDWAASADAVPLRMQAPSDPITSGPRTSLPMPQPLTIVPSPAPIPMARVFGPDVAPVRADAAPSAVAGGQGPQPVATVAGPLSQPPADSPEALAPAATLEPAPVVVSPLTASSATGSSTTPAPAPVPVAPPQPRRSALDSIVGGIGIPAEELEVRRTLPRVVPTIAKPAPKPVIKPDPKKAKADAAKADAAKADAKKAKPDPAKAEPARWWVQVAGGANASDLGKDWKRLVTKSPGAFRGKSAWITPSRATNRLLAGPFKTKGEATSFVNLLAKDGSSAFAWQSEAGQVVTKFATK